MTGNSTLPKKSPMNNQIIFQTSQLEIGQGKFKRSIADIFLNEGELIHIKGNNGCGKSTLLKTIAGKLAPISGSFKYDLTYTPLAYIPQVGGQEISLPLTLKEWLECFGVTEVPSQILSEFVLEKRWRDASGGERQKVSLLAKIKTPGALLLLDEPFNHVDEKGKIDTELFLHSLLKDKFLKGVIIVSHQALIGGRVVNL